MSSMSDTPREVAVGRVKQTDAAGGAASAVLGSVLAEVVGDGNSMPEVKQAAAEHLRQMGVTDVPGTPAPAVVASAAPQQTSDPRGMVGAVVEGMVPSPALAPVETPAPTSAEAPVGAEPEIPDDVQAWLAEADDEDDEEEEPVASDEDEEVGEEEYEDEQTARLRKRLAKAEKTVEHERKLRVQASRGKWEAEVRKSGLTLTDDDVAGIAADSRRGFWREAKKLHDRNQAVLTKLGVNPAQVRAQVTEQVTAETREDLKEAWGKPLISGPAPAAAVTTANEAYMERVQRARQGSSFNNLVKTILHGPDE